MHVILPAVVPVLVTVLVGYGLAKAQKPFDAKTVGFIVGTIGTPVLIFSNLSGLPTIPPEMIGVALATVLSILVFLAIGAGVLRMAGLGFRAFLPSLAFPNTGNLGLPLALYAFGEEGLSFAIVMFALHSVSNFTLGQTIAAGRGEWRTALTSPVVPAAFLGVACAELQVPLPLWFNNTLEILAGLTIPLMLLMLGTSLARIEVTAFGRAAALGALRLGMGTAVGFLLADLFAFQGAARAAFVLQCSMPVAIYNYFFAQMYNNAPEDVASLVVVSTLMSVVTVPVLLAVLAG